ncbi:MAG TPA: response regulator, partial [Nitrososphaeraceae archaeon]|nr:response regulator [Nitrososphaeraceae archaeon]
SIYAYKYYVIHSQLDNLMDSSPPQIAIMDNDDDTLNLFTDVINMQGYLVIGFVNPYFLIDYINENPEQLKFIIIDYRMPQMTGCELANQINKINPKIKMVFVTGYDKIVNNTLNLEIFKKPLTVPQIIEVVNKHMNL